MTHPPFTRDLEIDTPAIVGARWWQKSLHEPVSRRVALAALFALAGTAAGVAVVSSLSPSFAFQDRVAIDMQRKFGWSFGAVSERLVFDGASKTPFDRSALARLSSDLAPRSLALAPYYVPTLFQSPPAVPPEVPGGYSGTVSHLGEMIEPISTPRMTRAYARGMALGPLAAPGLVIFVDLLGPEAVAFAAGSADSFEPVFLFDNWPHPRGVVSAHLTLAAAAYYQPLFVRAAQARTASKPPMFVLDRARLAAYVDDADHFDNRHLARVPSATNLASLGVKTVVYIPPEASDRELDDLNEVLVQVASRFALAMAPASSLDDLVTTSDHPVAPWRLYVPVARVTPYSDGLKAGGAAPIRPPSFGNVEVAVDKKNGAILGAKMSRSGSWNRASSSTGG